MSHQHLEKSNSSGGSYLNLELSILVEIFEIYLETLSLIGETGRFVLGVLTTTAAGVSVLKQEHVTVFFQLLKY